MLDVNGSGKHSSSILCVNNYDCKKFKEQAPAYCTEETLTNKKFYNIGPSVKNMIYNFKASV